MIHFTPGQRLPIRLSSLNNFSQREAAKLLGVKEAAISTRLRRPGRSWTRCPAGAASDIDPLRRC